MKTAIWWVRRDLRLTDNPALRAALDSSQRVVPLFILDPTLLSSSYASDRRTAFLLDGLRCLDQELRARGSRLIVRAGDPAEVLAKLAAECVADALYAERDHSPYAVQRDRKVARTLRAATSLHFTDGVAIRPVGAVTKDDGQPYTVFTPFSRRWKTLPPVTARDILAAADRLPNVGELASVPIPEKNDREDTRFPPGEAAALARLDAFTSGASPPIHRYAAERNRPDLGGISQLSPYLRFGMLSARAAATRAYAAVETAPNDAAQESADNWLNELIWRDFFINVLHHFPHVRGASFRSEYDAIDWRNDPDEFDAWCHGRTGYPFVDAAMRQLAATGWMHNRARMVVASFLVKDLLIDWQWGERWFMRQLLDGDPAANNGGWQWSAGVGTDAAPYFRIFNPVTQGRKFDPEGRFVRCWVPELADVPDRFIHAPWEMPTDSSSQLRLQVGQSYPPPIVDHQFARKRTLDAFATAKDQA